MGFDRFFGSGQGLQPLIPTLDSLRQACLYQGVKMTYVNGDHCNRANTARHFFNDSAAFILPCYSLHYRSLTLSFICADKLSMGTFGGERVFVNDNECNYQISIESAFGCHQECPMGGNRRLCAGNGFCGQDTDLNVLSNNSKRVPPTKPIIFSNVRSETSMLLLWKLSRG